LCLGDVRRLLPVHPCHLVCATVRNPREEREITMQQQALIQTSAERTQRSRRLIRMIVQYAVNILLVLAFIFPLLFMASASLKTSNDVIFSDMESIRGLLPVGSLTLNNYVAVFQLSPFLRFLLNSIIVSTISVF